MGLKSFARLMGIVFLFIGVLGFFKEHLFGLFHLNTTHNVIHLIVGMLGILASTQYDTAKLFANILGVIYLAMGIVGFFAPDLFGLMHVQLAENLLHFIIGGWALYLGFSSPQPIMSVKRSI